MKRHAIPQFLFSTTSAARLPCATPWLDAGLRGVSHSERPTGEILGLL